MLPLLALHKYWIYANRMRMLFSGELAHLRSASPEGPRPEHLVNMLVGDLGLFLAYRYGALYVVIEGWRQLELNDERINALLESENTDHLRRYRNATFHYQPEHVSPKMLGILDSPTSVKWVQELHAAFGQVLLARIKAGLPPEVVADTERLIADMLREQNADGAA